MTTQQTTPTRDEAVLSVDALAQEIRRVDGSHSLGAGALAEALMPFLIASAPAPASGRVDAVAVKGLEWVKTIGGAYVAAAFNGHYQVAERIDDKGWNCSGPDHEAIALGVALHIAKAEAQADYEQRIRSALSPAATPVSEAGGEPFQQRVQPWMMACFGAEISADRIERNHRFLEEALELVQSTGCTASEAHQLVDYVFGRDVGETHQEIGGVMVTLAALCLALEEDMHAAGETELARIWTKVEKIRAKQAAKPKHSPLSQALAKPASSPAGGDVVQTLIDKTEKLIEAADDMGWSCNSSSADQAIREARDAVRAALSQSTSAGRVGE